MKCDSCEKKEINNKCEICGKIIPNWIPSVCFANEKDWQKWREINEMQKM